MLLYCIWLLLLGTEMLWPWLGGRLGRALGRDMWGTIGLQAPNSGSAFVEALFQTLTLLGTGVWVRHNKIRGLGVQSSSGEFVSSVGCVLPHTGEDNESFWLLLFPSRSWGCGPWASHSLGSDTVSQVWRWPGASSRSESCNGELHSQPQRFVLPH